MSLEILRDTTDMVTQVAFAFLAKLAIAHIPMFLYLKGRLHMLGCQLFQQHSQIFSFAAN